MMPRVVACVLVPPAAPTPPSRPAPAGERDTLARLRASLLAADFTVERLDDLLGPVAAAALHREQPLPARLRLDGSSEPAAHLARLFVLGVAVDEAALDDALPGVGAAGLVELGLVEPDGSGCWVATCDLRPYGQESAAWWVASDRSGAMTDGPLPTDHVLGIGGASTTLASWTPRPRVGRALDLGIGCGVQSLHLGLHCDRVVGTDLSGRALAYAAFNAGLNGVDLELREGSFFEPVAGEGFDLIVSNPPFVITPRTDDVPLYEYRDGGATGDAVVAGLVRQVGEHLTSGGIAQLLGNWELRGGQDWTEVVGGWLDGTGLDAWVVQREVQDPAEYAETWARDGGHRPGTAEHEALYRAWLADFGARGVERVGFGVLTLKRPATGRPPWRRLEHLGGPTGGGLGGTVLAGLTAQTWLAEHDDEAVLATAWRVADDVTEERIGRPGAPDPAVIQLRQGGGLRRTVRLDSWTAGLVGACDGDLTSGQIAQALAALTGAAADDVLSSVLPALRELVAGGLLVAADAR